MLVRRFRRMKVVVLIVSLKLSDMYVSACRSTPLMTPLLHLLTLPRIGTWSVTCDVFHVGS